MAVIKPFSESKLPCEWGREGSGGTRSYSRFTVWALAGLSLAVCCASLVLFVRMTIQVHTLTEQVGNLSRVLHSTHNGISPDVLVEKMMNETNATAILGSYRQTYNRGKGRGSKRFLSGGPNLELLSRNIGSGVTAVHYVPHEFQDLPHITAAKCSGSCCFVWSGIFCANQTFMLNDPSHGVKFFRPSKWMTSQQIEEVDPLQQNSADPASFSVTSSGLYLLYLNILIQATKSSHDIAIYIDNNRKLDCRASLDYVRSDPADPFRYSKGKTCSISGVFYLTQGSELSIRILTVHTAVLLKPENTNFGAILLKT